MPTYINNETLYFDGVSSVADQFSNPVTLTTTTSTRDVAFFLFVDCTVGGAFGITLQFNPDPDQESEFGWQDMASTSLTILDTVTCANLAQTNGSISSGTIRGGIITGTGVYNLLFKFQPAPYKYRLRFQLNNTFEATIPKISFTSGA